eukprot:6174792-Pleurochrysis_carterae.AAC.1
MLSQLVIYAFASDSCCRKTSVPRRLPLRSHCRATKLLETLIIHRQTAQTDGAATLATSIQSTEYKGMQQPSRKHGNAERGVDT